MKEMTRAALTDQRNIGVKALVLSAALDLGDACSPRSGATRQSPMTSAASPVSAAAKKQH
jgi:hypothetical protein